jgi:hypothetical protein
MKRIAAFFVFVLLAHTACFSQQVIALPLKVEIKTEKEYEVVFSKEHFASEIQQYRYNVTGDSVIEKRYDIKLTITNTAAQAATIWLKNCSWEDNFLINNNYMSFVERDCEMNVPSIITFKPGETKTFETTLKKTIAFDYPCKNCLYEPQVETTKLGLIIVNDITGNKRLRFLDYRLYMQDKSKWQIVWSNPLNLLGKRTMAQ